MPIAIGTTKDENSIVAKGTYVWRICLYCHCKLAAGECGNLRAVGHHPTRLLHQATIYDTQSRHLLRLVNGYPQLQTKRLEEDREE
jgi:hypothetical protein